MHNRVRARNMHTSSYIFAGGHQNPEFSKEISLPVTPLLASTSSYKNNMRTHQ